MDSAICGVGNKLSKCQRHRCFAMYDLNDRIPVAIVVAAVVVAPTMWVAVAVENATVEVTELGSIYLCTNHIQLEFLRMNSESL